MAVSLKNLAALYKINHNEDEAKKLEERAKGIRSEGSDGNDP